jgi:hypothetical protein
VVFSLLEQRHCSNSRIFDKQFHKGVFSDGFKHKHHHKSMLNGVPNGYWKIKR